MNKTLYWIIGILLIVALGYGGYRIMKHYQTAANQVANTNMQANPSPTSSEPSSTRLSNKSDTSNTQLDQDIQNTQGSMNKLNTDQTQAGQAVSNQSSDIPLSQ